MSAKVEGCVKVQAEFHQLVWRQYSGETRNSSRSPFGWCHFQFSFPPKSERWAKIVRTISIWEPEIGAHDITMTDFTCELIIHRLCKRNKINWRFFPKLEVCAVLFRTNCNFPMWKKWIISSLLVDLTDSYYTRYFKSLFKAFLASSNRLKAVQQLFRIRIKRSLPF